MKSNQHLWGVDFVTRWKNFNMLPCFSLYSLMLSLEHPGFCGHSSSPAGGHNDTTSDVLTTSSEVPFDESMFLLITLPHIMHLIHMLCLFLCYFVFVHSLWNPLYLFPINMEHVTFMITHLILDTRAFQLKISRFGTWPEKLPLSWFQLRGSFSLNCFSYFFSR